nr:hypothetical protein Iba_chr13cCG5070 [Ipomoea batatas]
MSETNLPNLQFFTSVHHSATSCFTALIAQLHFIASQQSFPHSFVIVRHLLHDCHRLADHRHNCCMITKVVSPFFEFSISLACNNRFSLLSISVSHSCPP